VLTLFPLLARIWDGSATKVNACGTLEGGGQQEVLSHGVPGLGSLGDQRQAP
jgi:hypothetical protein